MMKALALVFALFTVSACSGPILANPPAVAGAPIAKATPGSYAEELDDEIPF